MQEADNLKLQGDGAFAQNQLSLAVELYSRALGLVPVHVGCMSNRSASFLALGDLTACIRDCSDAMALLQLRSSPSLAAASHVVGSSSSSSPAGEVDLLMSILPAAGTDKRRQWVLKTVVRRGSALVKAGRVDEAIADYSLASSIDPANEALRADLTKLCNYRDSKRSPVIV